MFSSVALLLVCVCSWEIVSATTTSSTSCTYTSGSCSSGSKNSITLNLVYDNSTGMFAGNLITNQCPPYTVTPPPTISCVKQTIPDTNYAGTKPLAIPVYGTMGWSLKGVNIYSAFDAGFNAGFLCTSGYCNAGTDIGTCETQLENTCTSSISTDKLPDSCGGHAMPYHLHLDAACDYDNTASAASTHSPLVGISLDGRGIYGKWEGNGVIPSDLDACNGHYGDVPSTGSYSNATNVYHYHITALQPYYMGCYGPATVTECRALYSDCSTSTTLTGVPYKYSIKCPCFQAYNGSMYNTDYVYVNVTSATTTSSASHLYSVHSSFLTVLFVLASSLMVLVNRF